MKKRLLLFGAVLSSTFTFAQNLPVSQTVENKTVVLEEFTGIYCGYCPDGHKIANTIATSNPNKVILVNIHSGGYAAASGTDPDLRTPHGDAINSWAVVQGYPAGMVQRRAISGELAVSRSEWSSMSNTVLSEASPVNIALDASIDASTREVSVDVEVFYTTPFTSGTNHYVYVGILQDNIEGPQSGGSTFYPENIIDGKYQHNHVFRGLINTGGVSGDQIDASSTGVISKNYTYTIPANIKGVDMELKDLKFYAFVSEGANSSSNSNIFTGAEVAPVVTTDPLPSAQMKSISDDLNIACETNPTITPVVKVYNSGAEITSIKFEAQVNNETPVTFDWTGSILPLESEYISITNIPAFSPLSSNNKVVVTIKSVEGGTGQIISTDNLTSYMAMAKDVTGYDFTVEVYTDNYPGETSWEMLNSSDQVVASGGPYEGNGNSSGGADALKVKTHDIQLDQSDCYSFKLYDSYGDGLNTGTNPYGNFGFKVKQGSQTIYYKTSDAYSMTSSNSSTSWDLVEGIINLTTTAGVAELENEMLFEVYPNPASTVLNVSFEADNADYKILINDISGRVIFTHVLENSNGTQLVQLPIEELASGNYVLTIQSAKGMVNKHFVVE